MTALIRQLSVDPPAQLSPAFVHARTQALPWRHATRHALECVGLAEGHSVLDVGAGCGDAMTLLARRVGPGGRVTGVDVDGALVSEALAHLRHMGLSTCSYLQGDVTRLPLPDAGSFDLVFVRLLVLHTPRPVELLRRLWALVRPGGALLVMDHDYSALANGSANIHPGLARALVVLQRLLLATYQYPRSCHDVPGLFQASGIGAPDGCEISSRVTPHADIVPWALAVLRDLRDRVAPRGSADARALDDLDVALMIAAADPRLARWPDMVSTWKRKPGVAARPAPAP